MKNIILTLIFGFSFIGYAQLTDIEKQTLQLYNDQNWTSLIKIAERAKEQKVSSYVIEYRLAVAYYNDHNYFDSATEFENIILKYQTKNDVILEYLYYSYLFSGRQQDALLVAKEFPFHLQEKTDTKKSEFIDYLSAEGGVKLSSRKDIDIENLNYLNLGLGQQLGYGVKVQHAFTSISQNYIDFDYSQKEYYGNMKIQLSKGLTLIPAYHYVNTSEKSSSSHGENNSDLKEIKNNLFHLALKQQWSRFSISPNLIYVTTKDNEYGNLNNFQYGLHAGYSLKSTGDKLWIGTGGDFINSGNNSDLVWNMKALYSISPKAYLYLRYLNANTTNFAVEDAMYYFNSVSTIIDNFSATFTYQFSPKFSWYINYQYENAKDFEYNITFNYNTIITGIKLDL